MQHAEAYYNITWNCEKDHKREISIKAFESDEESAEQTDMVDTNKVLYFGKLPI